ncbi:MAG: ribonuclease HII [Clostridia bacterium]|nr:ribonuclease HII [Clostridia bacterium]MDD4386768.1 ribonuclease HII [Clostridia bacterium]
MNIIEEQRIKDMLIYEQELINLGYLNIAGVDEAGRGPLCGPVVAAAVILPPNLYIEGVNDSKKLSEKKREKIYEEIVSNKDIVYAVGISDIDVIEKVNILNATKLAMIQAINNLNIKPDFVLIDGNQNIDIDIQSKTLVSGDSKSASIAAASIVAKVTRDRMMLEFDKEYPEYNFSKHKGYGTKLHIEAIKKYGLCTIHRPSFCKHFV